MSGVHPWTALAGFMVAASLFLLSALLVRAAFAIYRRRMLREVGQALEQQFIAASPLLLAGLGAGCATVLAVLTAVLLSLALAPLVALAGLAVPRVMLAVVNARRVRRFMAQMPDALQSMASALRSGATLGKALELMATQQPAPLSEEFALLLAKQRLGQSVGESLGELRQRMPSREVDLFNSAVLVSRRVGGNLADTLESLASTLREKAEVEGKIKSLTAIGRMQGWVLCLLPALVAAMLYLQQPAKMSRLFTDWIGLLVLAVVGVLMTMAILMIRRIVDIDV